MLGETYTQKLRSKARHYLTERNLNSCAVFTSTQFHQGFISDYHYEYLMDKIQEKIKEVLPSDCALGCNRLVFMDTDINTCLERIRYREEEVSMEEMGDYLMQLKSEYEDYFLQFQELNGVSSVLKIKSDALTESSIEKIKKLVLE